MSDTGSSNGWLRKFGVAISGLSWAVRTQSSFWVHVPVAVMVIVVATVLQVELWRWSALAGAIALVMTAELLNTAIEQLVAALHPDYDQRIGRALDVSAGGVLVASVGSIAIGFIVFAQPLWNLASQYF